MSSKIKIFEGLSLTVEAAQELARYWNVADNDIGTIDVKGNMRTSDDVWNRPCASRNYQVLRAALEACPVPWIIIGEKQIAVDFSKLRYNGEWLKKMFKNRNLGVCDTEEGLRLYQKRETSDKVWFEDQIWTLRDVTVASLGLEKSEVVSLSPNSQNPDEAEWAKLYFAA